MSRSHYNTWTRIRAVLSSPSLYRLAGAIEWDAPIGRRCLNPPYVTLAYGVLARIVRSGIRVELDLDEPHTWAAARQLMTEAITAQGLQLPPPGPRPPKWDHWRSLRDHHLSTDEGLALLGRVFPPIAAEAAHRVGLLLPDGPGSLTHPNPTRAAYGDGVLVRPLYRPPQTVLLDNDDGTTSRAYPHPRTGQLLDTPPGRFDPDLAPYHGQGGSVQTHGYVCWHTRGPHRYQRINLAVAHIPAPGAEAATAVQLLREVHRAAGTGVQVAVYDGALRGAHIEEIMRSYGYLVLADQHDDPGPPTGAATGLVKGPDGHRVRSHPLGAVSHQLPTGPCAHQLAAAGGRVVEIDLDDQGDPVIVGKLTRGPVKRSRRSGGQYHFNVGYQLACPREPVTVWLSPHPGRDGDVSRPEQLRILPTSDPDARRLHGIRSDAESFHSNYKRTLIVNRAMSLGWRRGLVDLYCYSLLENALAEHQAAQAADTAAVQPRTGHASRRLSNLG